MNSQPRFLTFITTSLWFITATVWGPQTAWGHPQNSTKKIRVQPNSLSQSAGKAIHWFSDWDAAKAESATKGKPIFWYIPTLPGTFMDRKIEIDRYLMSGPFSWPATIEMINENFVPLKASPNQSQQSKYKLNPYEFVEPGFLILESGKIQAKVDQISTFHHEWWNSILIQHSAREVAPDIEIDEMVDEFANARALKKRTGLSADQRAHYLMLTAMATFRNGDHSAADNIWRELIKKNPRHPLAAKASAEIQRIGPFSRGFEVFSKIPKTNMEAGIKSRGTRSVAGVFSPEQIWRRSTEFLLGMQHKSGGFLDSDYDFGGTDSLPNVHVAVTALAGMALIESLDHLPQPMRQRVLKAIDSSLQFVTDEKNINRIDRDEILWADAYRLRFICRFKALNRRDVSAQLQSAVTTLEDLQSKRGGWYHEYANPFVTATALCALKEGQKAGATLDLKRIEKGVATLKGERYRSGAFPYLSGRPINGDGSQQIIGAAGRMPLCEVALSQWDRSDQQRLISAISTSFAHHDQLNSAVKYDNHTSNHGYGGFFFWYDMRSRCEAIDAVGDEGKRAEFYRRQFDLVMSLPEIDGCFIDSHELGRCYGTAMALLCLAKSQPDGDAAR